ncbi:MAG: HAMP domain-containing sensor histidine kinase [Saprospiraceae bacterium]|nr:HAMP domain-containing histidine kinase [Saprospiraceae bacterium]MBK7468476.1 HAMP domain-containing histidine kinase [Saprospiraceae bacterium]MBK9994942.1 HAMP domain-containing histidine kinase [Saprospiraceae bacterium]
MNQRAIYLTVGLMAIALLGTAIIQWYWINWSVQLKEEQFEKAIKESLKRVAARIEDNGDYLNLSEQYIALKGSWEQQKELEEMKDRLNRINPPSLDKRIDPKNLDFLIKEELKDIDHSMKFSYSVFDLKMKSYIIHNGNFVVTLGENEKSSAAEIDPAQFPKESTYEVELFNSIVGSSGILKLSFPTKQKWLWKSVWPILSLSILLISLILACFSYVIYVVFRQKKLSEIKNDFVNNMTHEFKTPIATISLASDSIMSPMIINSPDKIKRFADIIKQENRRMLSQVEKVLQMALLDKHDFQLSLRSLDVHEIIQQAVNNINLQVTQRHGTLEMELKATQSNVYADQTHLTNIIYNLLDNANKYSPESPKIVIRTRNTGTMNLEISVQDSGIGMTKESQKLIFEKFYRVPTGNLHNVKGFGLGLSYVKAMVHAHNGKIRIISELNHGSTFILDLPIHIS